MRAALIGKNIVSKAISHIGEMECPMGSNSGREVNRYLEYAGVDISAPASEKAWCASFACYIIGMTLLQMALSLLHPNTPSSHEMVNWGINHDTIIADPKRALPGDVVILAGGDGEAAQDGKSYHHTLLLESVGTDGLHCIAGNDGDQVRRSLRPFAGCTILRPYVLAA